MSNDELIAKITAYLQTVTDRNYLMLIYELIIRMRT